MHSLFHLLFNPGLSRAQKRAERALLDGLMDDVDSYERDVLDGTSLIDIGAGGEEGFGGIREDAREIYEQLAENHK